MWVALALERSVAGADVTAEDEVRPKQVNQSLLTVLIAFLANLLIAILRSPVIAPITSSASMLAEGCHPGRSCVSGSAERPPIPTTRGSEARDA